MVERLSPTRAPLKTPASRLETFEHPTLDFAPFEPLIVPAIEVLAAQSRLGGIYNTALKRMKRLVRMLPKSTEEPATLSVGQVATGSPRPFSVDDMLPSTLKFIEQLERPPLLPAPPSFERAFSPYENMFHTVFYRRYPYERLNDAKQDALIHLWKHWKRDMTLLEQSAAYVVQAAIWGASPHRKIEREKRIQDHELPMLPYERYIDIHVADQSRDPSWVLHVDQTVDIQSAIGLVTQELQTQPDAAELLSVLDDILNERTLKEGRQNSKLSFRGYKRTRDEILNRLRTLLADYAPA